jgi:predicted lipid carrier protein YhbT
VPRQAPLVLQPETVEALLDQVFCQNSSEPEHAGSKARRLSDLCADLELSVIIKAPQSVTGRLCLEVAAQALRIFEQGD